MSTMNEELPNLARAQPGVNVRCRGSDKAISIAEGMPPEEEPLLPQELLRSGSRSSLEGSDFVSPRALFARGDL